MGLRILRKRIPASSQQSKFETLNLAGMEWAPAVDVGLLYLLFLGGLCWAVPGLRAHLRAQLEGLAAASRLVGLVNRAVDRAKAD